MISAATSHTPQSAEAHEILRDLRDADRRAIADKEAGILPSDTDPEALAHFYATVIQGMSHQARDGAGHKAFEQVAAKRLTARTVLTAWLMAISTRPSGNRRQRAGGLRGEGELGSQAGTCDLEVDGAEPPFCCTDGSASCRLRHHCSIISVSAATACW
ncbi:hypothetical protein GCM10010168_64850 [Actinoplanes ianthinogenes]|uniref:Uncharacterized protein n=1 Tax=Actinoplanes ianthinogenes TaxID=122358 RepID=A0ABM7LS58_9ACTN|nr:hypothetical protein [Actinoplanes ianthinogenes]BCJ42137.1 hypothetical protein Aiant_27940 [Actinoplanes ianthinogenes]GGR37466.1 hypothetical protein GCM10010168_64850 [Actinoplanes ianthinogenes]